MSPTALQTIVDVLTSEAIKAEQHATSSNSTPREQRQANERFDRINAALLELEAMTCMPAQGPAT